MVNLPKNKLYSSIVKNLNGYTNITNFKKSEMPLYFYYEGYAERKKKILTFFVQKLMIS